MMWCKGHTWNQKARSPTLALPPIPTVMRGKLPLSAPQFPSHKARWLDTDGSLRTILALTSYESKTLRSKDAVALILSLLSPLEKGVGGLWICSPVLLQRPREE